MDSAYGNGLGSIFALLGFGFIFTGLALSIFSLICHWMVYEKAGQPGWAVIVPIYGFIVFCRIIGKPWTWILLLIPPVFIVGIFIIWIGGSLALARNFGKDTLFALGLMFLPFIFYAILAFDKNIRYKGPNGDDNTLDNQIESIGKPAF